MDFDYSDLENTIFDSDSDGDASASSDDDLLINALISDGDFSDDDFELVAIAIDEDRRRFDNRVLSRAQNLTIIEH